jgi:hypothetical protein
MYEEHIGLANNKAGPGHCHGPCLTRRHKAPGSSTESSTESNIQRHAAVAIVALCFLVVLVILQVVGLVYAAKGYLHSDALTVAWCSPAFQDNSMVVQTGNCEFFPITISASKGIGCMNIPGTEQRGWLLGTIISLVFALILQSLDALLMSMSKTQKFRGVKLQRPWLTMIAGVVVLGILIAFGVFQSRRLPAAITETIWVYRKEPNAAEGRICQGIIDPSGLRGMLIGWLDGVLGNWGEIYSGIS